MAPFPKLRQTDVRRCFQSLLADSFVFSLRQSATELGSRNHPLSGTLSVVNIPLLNKRSLGLRLFLQPVVTALHPTDLHLHRATLVTGSRVILFSLGPAKGNRLTALKSTGRGGVTSSLKYMVPASILQQ